MKAILVNPADKSLSWADVPDPVLAEDEVLVEIHYAALNRADLMQRTGDYPPPPGCPEWMGLEISGVIVEMTEGAKAKSNWKIGDQVCALLGGGGYAEYVSIKYDMLMPVPEGISLMEAACMPEAFATAYLNLFYTNSGSLQLLQLYLRMVLSQTSSANAIMAQVGAESTGYLSQTSTQMAIVVITVIPIMIVYPWLSRFYVSGLTTGAVKG